MASAVEEFLRAYSPVTIAREVVKDTEVGGCRFEQGQMVLLSFPAANRDPTMFDHPERVTIDREINRHIAFGIGIHRCIGSSLARMEIAVALEEWLVAIPEFHLDPSVALRWSQGTMRGPRRLPILFE
jgi:cytochrome P450